MVIKEAFSADIIKNGELWFDMINDRNLTSYEYNMDKVNMDYKEVLFVAKQKRSFIFLYIIGCLIFVLGGIYLIHLSDIYSIKVGYISIIFFGLFCLPKALIDFISPKTLLCLAKSGFYLNLGEKTKQIYFEYNNISEMDLLRVNSTKIICFTLKDKSRVSFKQNFIKKLLMELNNIAYGYEFSVPLQGTGANTEKVFGIMQTLINENK